LNVLDLSRDVAGGFAAKLLAMGGFDVIRPLHPEGPDPTRSTTITGPLAVYLDAHKRRISWPAEAAFASLVEAADVVFTTFDRGRYVGLGRVHQGEAITESCVHVTTSTFGTTGPYAALAGGPLAEWAAGGYLAILAVRRDFAIQRLQARPLSEPPLVSLHAVLRELCERGYERQLLAQIRAVLALDPRFAGEQLSFGFRAFEKTLIATLESRIGQRETSLEIRALTEMAESWFLTAVRAYLKQGRLSLVEYFDEVVAACARSIGSDLVAPLPASKVADR
jgi:hypothetical protein